MNAKLKRAFYCFYDLAALLFFIYLIAFPKAAAQPTKTALEFCSATLIPSLFIYMVLSKMIITLPITEKFLDFLGLELFSLATGTLCGCPLGAKNAMTLYEQGRITKKHAEYLCSFTNNAGVSFIFGFIGNELLGDSAVAFRILIYQLSASLITSYIMKKLIFGKERLPKVIKCKVSKIGLREAVSDSANTMISICAYAVFFMVLGSVLVEFLHLKPEGEAVIRGILEFSSGCAAGAKCGYLSLPLIAFAIGQTGLCVALQVKSIIGSSLSIRPYFTGKLISCAFMVAMAVIFG